MDWLPAVVIGAALTVDLLFGDPPNRFHPVAWFGRLIQWVDRPWARPRLVGVVVAVSFPLLVAVGCALLVGIGLSVHPILGAAIATGVLAAAVSLRMLLSVAAKVNEQLDTDIDRAKETIIALVGRDTTELSPGLLRSAIIESLAENLSDGFVAPLTGFVIGAQFHLGLGVALAAWVKAVNTLDSMLGYRSKPIGWASARLDDIVMWLPARLTAILLAVASGQWQSLLRARTWAQAPPSPNAGWPMATIGVILDTRLENPGRYVLNERGATPTNAVVRRGIRTTGIAGVLAAGVAVVMTWL